MRSDEILELLKEGDSLLTVQRRDHVAVREKMDQWSGELARSAGNPQVSFIHDQDCPRTVNAAEDCTCEGSPLDYSDRTGEQVLRGPDPFRRCKTEYERHIARAVESLRKAERIRLMATTKPQATDDVTWCHSCARLVDTATGRSTHVPARPGGTLCEWCQEYRQTHAKGQGRNGWPPLMLVEMHHRGQAISTLARDRAEKMERKALPA